MNQTQTWIDKALKTAIIIVMSTLTAAVTYGFAAGKKSELLDNAILRIDRLDKRVSQSEAEMKNLVCENTKLKVKLLEDLSDIKQEIAEIKTDVRWLTQKNKDSN